MTELSPHSGVIFSKANFMASSFIVSDVVILLPWVSFWEKKGDRGHAKTYLMRDKGFAGLRVSRTETWAYWLILEVRGVIPEAEVADETSVEIGESNESLQTP